MRYLLGFGRFWWDFVVGEDWRIAAAVTGILSAGAILVSQTRLSDTVVTLLVGGAILVMVSLSIVVPALSAKRRRGRPVV